MFHHLYSFLLVLALVRGAPVHLRRDDLRPASDAGAGERRGAGALAEGDSCVCPDGHAGIVLAGRCACARTVVPSAQLEATQTEDPGNDCVAMCSEGEVYGNVCGQSKYNSMYKRICTGLCGQLCATMSVSHLVSKRKTTKNGTQRHYGIFQKAVDLGKWVLPEKANPPTQPPPRLLLTWDPVGHAVHTEESTTTAPPPEGVTFSARGQPVNLTDEDLVDMLNETLPLAAIPPLPVTHLSAAIEEIGQTNATIRSMAYQLFRSDAEHSFSEYRSALKNVTGRISTMRKKMHNQLLARLLARGLSEEEAETDMTLFLVKVEKEMFGQGRKGLFG